MSDRTVLIVAHLPYGTPRIPGLVKYLPENAWKAIVVSPKLLTAEQEDLRVIETPYRPVLGSLKQMFGMNPEEGIRFQVRNRLSMGSHTLAVDHFLRLTAQLVNYPDAHRRWRRAASPQIEALMTKENISAVVSSSPPVTAHIIARDVKVRYSIPWIADLRDLWTQNHNYGYGSIRRRIELRLERKTLGAADVLVTVSRPWADSLKMVHPEKSVRVITNGFDPAHVNGGNHELPEKFTITYTGSIYPPKQDPWNFFLAVKSLIDNGTVNPRNLGVRFYTPHAPWLDREICDAGLNDVVIQHGIVPHEKAIRLQQESHALLLLNWEDPAEKGCYPLKTFEYLAAKRPILSIGGSGDDVVTALLSKTRAGRSCLSVDAIKQYLMELYREYQTKRTVTHSGVDERILKYSYREMAAQFAAILDRVTGSITA